MAPSIVLVHGGFVDGSGWEGVYNILKRDGYSVGVVQNATKSHADDVATTIEKANEIDDRPVVIDFRTDYREKVYPMVPAGASNDDIILGPEFGEGGR